MVRADEMPSRSEVEGAAGGEGVGALVEVAQLPGEQRAERYDDGDDLPPVGPGAGGDVAFATLVFFTLLDDAAPDENAVDGHHEVVDADGTVGVDAGGEVDDGVEGRHQQAEGPEPAVGAIFADDIEEADNGAGDFEDVHLMVVYLF